MTSEVTFEHSGSGEQILASKPSAPSPDIAFPFEEEERSAVTLHSLKERVQPVHTKELLKILLDQVRQYPGHTSELILALQEQKEKFPESVNEFDEVIELLETEQEAISQKIDALDSEKCGLLDDWVYVDKIPDEVKPPPGYEKTWASYALSAGGAVWYVTKTSGTVLYFLCDHVLLNGNVLRIAAATGSVVSVINLMGSPALPVLQTVAVFIIRRLISL